MKGIGWRASFTSASLAIALLAVGIRGEGVSAQGAPVMPRPVGADWLTAVGGVSASDIWAVGANLTHQRDDYKTLIEHWDGRAWTRIPSKSPAGPKGENWLQSVGAESATDVWAVGWYADTAYHALVEHWDGHHWNQVTIPVPAGKTGLELGGVTAVSSDDVWVVGEDYSGQHETTLTEHWDGSRWSVVSSPSPGGIYGLRLNAVTAISSDDVWAVGYTTSRSRTTALMEHWNGTRWARVMAPSPQGVSGLNLTSAASTSAGHVWAVGYYSGKVGEGLVEHWNGRRWVVIPSPHPGGANESELYGVSATTSHDAWLVGYYRKTHFAPLVEHWNGKRWTRLNAPGGRGFSRLTGVLALAPNNVWAVGHAASDMLIDHWNGTHWTHKPPATQTSAPCR